MGEKGSGIFYGWWVVATCFLSLLFAGGALFYALPVFLKPLAAEFGWDRGDISAGISATFIGQVFVAPLLGALISRYGARVVMIPAAILAGLSLLLLTWLDHLLEFHVVRVLMGVALVGLAFIPATVTIFGWFRKNRGTGTRNHPHGLSPGRSRIHPSYRWSHCATGLADDIYGARPIHMGDPPSRLVLSLTE